MRKSNNKQLVIARTFEFGGSNSHLRTLIRYLGPANIILVLENQDQYNLLKNIVDPASLTVLIRTRLHQYAHLNYRFTTNIKELFGIIRSIFSIRFLIFKYRCSGITISCVEPEKYLYLLWLPFTRVFYILHTAPGKTLSPFTPYTCKVNLAEKKRIITVSHANKKLISEKWGIPAIKKEFVEVVYNCPPFEETKPETVPATANDKKYIVTMGHVTDYKNPFIWFDVARLVISQYSNAYFIWLGDGPLLKEMTSASLQTTQISFEGYQPNVGSYLKMATIYYQPSLEETHGIAVVEAMAAGLPCITADRGGLPESVQDGHNGFLLDALDVTAQANAILTLLNDPGLCTQFGVNSYKRYREKFTYPFFEKSMNHLYVSVN